MDGQRENYKKLCERKLEIIDNTHGIRLEIRRSMSWKTVMIPSPNVRGDGQDLFTSKSWKVLLEKLEAYLIGLNQGLSRTYRNRLINFLRDDVKRLRTIENTCLTNGKLGITDRQDLWNEARIIEGRAEEFLTILGEAR